MRRKTDTSVAVLAAVSFAFCLASSAALAQSGDQVELKLKLPKPAFKGTPKNAPPGTNLEKPRSGPRPNISVPKGTVNIVAGKPINASDTEPITGKLSMVTDGDKEAGEGGYVELGPMPQWVQLDLGEAMPIQAIVVWHYHLNARIYHDVIVQVSDDKDFTKDVKTLYNSDHDNSAGMGVGEDKEYWETHEGRLIEGKGVTARYVRLYSNGSSADDQNHYTEVEVYATPKR